MPVTIRVDPGTRVRVQVSPLVELGHMLHALSGPDHHDLTRWLPAAPTGAFAAALDRWSFTVRAVRARAFVHPPAGPRAGLDDELAALAALPPDRFALGLLRPLLYRHGGRNRSVPDRYPPSPLLRRHVLAMAAARGDETADAVRLVLTEPEAARTELLALVGAARRAFFDTAWPELAPALEAADRRVLRHPALGYHPDRGVLRVAKVRNSRIDATARGVTVLPTVAGDPHLLVVDDPPAPVRLCVPVVAGPPAPAVPAPDPGEVLRRLALVAHPLRLEVLRAVAAEERTATEIARLWQVHPSQVTRQLRALRAAGLVRAERRGRWVAYRLDPDQVAGLGTDLLALLRR